MVAAAREASEKAEKANCSRRTVSPKLSVKREKKY